MKYLSELVFLSSVVMSSCQLVVYFRMVQARNEFFVHLFSGIVGTKIHPEVNILCDERKILIFFRSRIRASPSEIGPCLASCVLRAFILSYNHRLSADVAPKSWVANRQSPITNCQSSQETANRLPPFIIIFITLPGISSFRSRKRRDAIELN